MNIDFTFDELATLCRMISTALISGKIETNRVSKSVYDKVSSEFVKAAQGDEIETVETRYITGERRIITLLDGKEISNVVIGADGKESIKLEDELEKLCKPVVEWLEKNAHPHALICITTDRIELLESTVGIPVKNG